MTPEILSQEAFAALGNPTLVYVRPVRASEVLTRITAPEDQEIQLDPAQIVYAVHRANGEPLAVITNHDAAFALARAHELAPVSVH